MGILNECHGMSTEEAMMEAPKMIWIGADWKAERDHCGLDHRCGRFSTERFYEDDKGYVPADLADALVKNNAEVEQLRERVKELEGAITLSLQEAINQIEYLHGKFQETGTGNAVIARLQSALAALKAMEG